MTSFVTNISSWRNYAVKQIKINNALFKAAQRGRQESRGQLRERRSRQSDGRTDGRADGRMGGRIISSHARQCAPRLMNSQLIYRRAAESNVDPASAIYCESIALTRPLRRSAARSSATNNTLQQGLIICCRWQSINHTINFGTRSVSVASTRSYVVSEMDDRIIAKENSRDFRGDALSYIKFASEETPKETNRYYNPIVFRSDSVYVAIIARDKNKFQFYLIVIISRRLHWGL